MSIPVLIRQSKESSRTIYAICPTELHCTGNIDYCYYIVWGISGFGYNIAYKDLLRKTIPLSFYTAKIYVNVLGDLLKTTIGKDLVLAQRAPKGYMKIRIANYCTKKMLEA